MKKIFTTLFCIAMAMVAWAQTDVWVWKDGFANKNVATDSVTFAEPASLGDILVWKDNKSTALIATDSITFATPYLENGYEYVDLGLTSGTKWATCNVGAANPQVYGDYFAWGETATKSTYSWNTYLDGNITGPDDCGTGKDALNGVTDIAGTQYDAATANWGGKWRIPTKAQQDELRSECYFVWTSDYKGSNVKGYIVYKAKADEDKGVRIFKNGTPSASYSLSDAHVFLPVAGYRSDGDILEAGSCCYYWASSLHIGSPEDAWGVYIDSNFLGVSDSNRYYGQSVRAVIPAE